MFIFSFVLSSHREAIMMYGFMIGGALSGFFDIDTEEREGGLIIAVFLMLIFGSGIFNDGLTILFGVLGGFLFCQAVLGMLVAMLLEKPKAWIKIKIKSNGAIFKK